MTALLKEISALMGETAAVRKDLRELESTLAIKLHEAREDRDRYIRAFNRLEAAVSHHAAATEHFREVHDEGLYHARGKVLASLARG